MISLFTSVQILKKTSTLLWIALFIFSPYGQGILEGIPGDFLKVKTAQAALTAPTDVDDVTLWLDGEDLDGDGTAEGLSEAGQTAGAVSTWVDKSGQGNDATAGVTPTLTLNELNSKPALIFNNDTLETVATDVIAADSGYTKFAVFKYDASSGNNLISSSTAAFLGGNSTDLQLYHNGFITSATTVADTSRYYIGVARYGDFDDTGISNVVNVDGTEEATNTTVATFAEATTQIGSFGGASFLQGRIAEAIVYDRALTDAEIDCVEGYLSTKWGVAVSSTEGACLPATSITLDATDYPEHKVFQRDGSDQYDFSLSGTYAGTCTAVEASFDGGAYETIDASPAGNTFSGTLSDQDMGQGDLVVRCTNEVSETDTASNIGVGDVYVVAGQSNAEGHGENAQSYATTGPTATVYPTVFSESDTWQVGDDSTDPDGTGSSVWPILGGYIVENTGIPVAFITTAEGGSRLTEGGALNKDGGSPSGYNVIVNQVTDSGVNDIKAVLWFQGESDVGQVTQEVYNEELDELVTDLQGDLVGTPDLVAGVIGRWGTPGVSDIRNAIMEAWSDNDSVLYGPQTYDIDITDGEGDDIHFYEDSEMQTLGYRWWKSLEDHYYSGTEGRGPAVDSALLGDDGDTITVTFTANSDLKPLAGLATAPWTVDDDGDAIVVTAVDVSGTTDVVLTLTSAVTSDTVTISYAEENTGEGVTVLTDSVTGNTGLGPSALPADPFVDFAVTIAAEEETSSTSSGKRRTNLPQIFSNPIPSVSAISATLESLYTQLRTLQTQLEILKNQGDDAPVSESCPRFTQLFEKGQTDDELIQWQAFLNKELGITLPLTGFFGSQTDQAIRDFQAKYRAEILAPWGLTQPTGTLYKTTRGYANKLVGCGTGTIELDGKGTISY